MDLSFGELVDVLTATSSASGQKDLVRLDAASCYSALRSLPWPWNWTWSSATSQIAITETEAASWVAGNDYVQFDNSYTPLCDYTHTGRTIRLNSQSYRLMNIGTFGGFKRYYVDRVFDTSGSAILTSYREDFALRTSQVEAVLLERQKLVFRTEQESDTSYTRIAMPGDLGPAKPTDYTVEPHFKIPAPRDAPTLSVTSSGTLAVGKYRYRYTRVDLESLLESEPGPYTEIEHTTGFAIDVTYGLTDASENTSYALRLYRTLVVPRSASIPLVPPMWLLQTRSPTAQTFPYNDTIVSNVLRQGARLWQSNRGKQVRIRLLPAPDLRHTLRVKHIDDLDFGFDDSDMLHFGEADVLLDLLKLYIRSQAYGTSRDGVAAQAEMQKYNQQLNYLLGSQTGNRADRRLDEEVRSATEGPIPLESLFNSTTYNVPSGRWW